MSCWSVSTCLCYCPPPQGSCHSLSEIQTVSWQTFPQPWVSSPHHRPHTGSLQLPTATSLNSQRYIQVSGSFCLSVFLESVSPSCCLSFFPELTLEVKTNSLKSPAWPKPEAQCDLPPNPRTACPFSWCLFLMSGCVLKRTPWQT